MSPARIKKSGAALLPFLVSVELHPQQIGDFLLRKAGINARLLDASLELGQKLYLVRFAVHPLRVPK